MAITLPIEIAAFAAKFAKTRVFFPPSFTGDLRLSLPQGSRSVSRQRRRGSISDDITDIKTVYVVADIADIADIKS